MDATPGLKKEPWLAVCLSWSLPGLGQLYAGAWVGGLLILTTWLAAGLGVGWLLLWPSSRASLIVAGVLIIAAFLLWLAGVLLSHRPARRANSPESEAWRKQRRDPFLAAFLTQVFPGWGHCYLRRWVAGPLLILASLVVWLVVPTALWAVWKPFGIVAGIGIWAAYKAATTLWAYRVGPAERRSGWRGITTVCLVGLLVTLLQIAAALVMRQYVVEAFNMPTASMAPTIQPGDHILVWKRPFALHRGDLIVFLNPNDRRVEYVKRVAAVAGETIEFRRDGAYVNGALLDRNLFGGLPYKDAEAPPSLRRWANESSPFTVPPGYVFVLGDNIGRSFDSRFFGPVPVSDIIGKAYKRYWPPQRAGPLE